jgi:tRNA-splicing ligase RtcB
VTEVVVHAQNIDEVTKTQIEEIGNHPVVDGLVAIMPDCHAGAGCVIGFTGRFKGAVIPNVVGVDIGCGVVTAPIEGVRVEDADFEGLDRFIRKRVPLGMTRHKDPGALEEFRKKHPERYRAMMDLAEDADREFFGRLFKKGAKYATWSQLGTLGGGNHFIEVDEDPETKKLFVTVHTGSRHFGFQVANHFQGMARQYIKKKGITGIGRGLEYLPMSEGGEEYMKWLRIAQRYAEHNRFVIIDQVLDFYGQAAEPHRIIQSVHNYISDRDGIVRKGAISAYAGESVVIPLNMAAGVILGSGKGNPRYNFSAPHGAGRVLGRKEMKRRLKAGELSMEDFRKSMEGIYSTSISKDTIDESPMAYKKWEDIRQEMEETVTVEKLLRPVYNLKAPE